MKYIWEEKDITHGRFYHRGEVKEGCGPQSYAKSCLHKIGSMHLGSHITHAQSEKLHKKGKKRLFVSMAMTDGLVFGLFTAKEFAEHLTDGGYEPTTAKQLVILLDNRKMFKER